MSALLKTIVLSTFAIAATGVLAADTKQSVDTVQVVSASNAKYWVAPDEFMYLGGSYPLNNGSSLQFRKAGSNHFFVSISGMPETEVYAQSATRFVAKDKSVQLSFAVHESGLATDLTVQYRLPNSVAQTSNPSDYIVASNQDTSLSH
jgi:hypothetical protein